MAEIGFPASNSSTKVLYDKQGAGSQATAPGRPPITGHDTIHLIDGDGQPVCGVEKVYGVERARADLHHEIDECEACAEAVAQRA